MGSLAASATGVVRWLLAGVAHWLHLIELQLLRRGFKGHYTGYWLVTPT
jgi:hypothetical protein